MRYHFLAYDSKMHDFKATARFVLDDFLKGTLKELKADPQQLDGFLENYKNDLQICFESLFSVLKRVREDKLYYKLFSILNLSTFLYPLIIRLQSRDLLDHEVPNNPGLDFINLIEIADVRIYKTRGTDPARDISILARNASELKPEEISTQLLSIVKNFMSDAEFRSRLEQDVYGNQALPYIFIEYDEEILANDREPSYDLQKLIEFNQKNPTIEHIFPVEPTLSFPSKGFNSEQDYRAKIHNLGNLTLLSKSLNSRCQNYPVEEKITRYDLYQQSEFKITQKLLAEIKIHGGKFCSTNIDDRTKILTDFIVKRWPLWNEP